MPVFYVITHTFRWTMFLISISLARALFRDPQTRKQSILERNLARVKEFYMVTNN